MNENKVDFEDKVEVDLDPKTWVVSGYAKMPAGIFLQDINIDGFGNLNGDFECDNLRVNGLLRAKGNLILHGDLSCDGMFRGMGKIQCDENIMISGATTIRESTRIEKSMKIGGTFKAKDNVIIGLNCKIDGLTKISGDLKVGGDLQLNGRTKITGDVVANTIQIKAENKGIFTKFMKSRINGNIVGTERVELSNCVVKGNVQTQDLILGERVKIYGIVNSEHNSE